MYKMIKRCFAVFLIIVLSLSALPLTEKAFQGAGAFTAAAAETGGACGDSLFWSYNSKTKKLTISGTGEMWNWYNKDPGWYSYHSEIKSVVIESGVTRVGDYAFHYCTALNTITIPETVISIGANSFENTAFYNNTKNWTKNILYIGKFLIASRTAKIKGNISIKSGTEIIADNAFFSCSGLAAITLPSTVKVIGKYAFYKCSSLVSITIPGKTDIIGNYAFNGCEKLKAVTAPKTIEMIGENVFDNTAFYSNNENWTQDGALYINKHLIRVDGRVATDSFNVKSGTASIADGAFSGCDLLKSVSVSSGITNIGANMFKSCTLLSKVSLPGTVATIGSNAFYNCKALSAISLPDSLTSIADSAFSFCVSLKSIDIPAAVLNIGDSAFYGCKSLISITVNSNNSRYTAVNGVLFNKSKSYLLQYPMANTQPSYKIPSTVTSVAQKAFANSYSLTSVTLSAAMLDVSDYMFYNCTALTRISLTSNITRIGVYAFALCKSLSSVTLPANLAEIGICAFSGCGKLKSISIPSSVKSIAKDSFLNCHKDFIVYCSEGSYAKSFANNNSIKYKLLTAAVSGLKRASSTTASIKLTWSKTSKATGYRVYKYNSSIKKYMYYKDVTGTSCTVTGLSSGTAYRFKVTAYRTVNGARYYGQRSAAVSAITLPATVTGVMASAKTTKTVTLNWKSVANATGYRVYKYDASKEKYVLYKTVTKNACTVADLKSSTTYRFKVRAFRTYGSVNYYGGMSSTLIVKTK